MLKALRINEKMTKKTKEMVRTRLYTSLVSGAQALTQRVRMHGVSAGFDNFVDEHNRLLEQYIRSYTSFNLEEKEDLSRLLLETKQYIHASLDVIRIREMRAPCLKPIR